MIEQCSQEQFNGLYDAANKSRGENVTVSKEALFNLLQDHAALWAALSKVAA